MKLNEEQKKVAFHKPNGHSLIRGIAGSGKTSVGIYRIPFLVDNFCPEPDDRVLFVTFNKTLTHYVSFLHRQITGLQRRSIKQLEIKTIDSVIHDYFRAWSRKHPGKYRLGLSQRDCYQIIAEGVDELKPEFPGIRVLDKRNKSFLYEEIRWIKACNYMTLQEYQEADRLGVRKGEAEERPQKLRKHSDTRKAIFQLMCYTNARMRLLGFIDYYDMALYALEQVRHWRRQQYTHIIADESQDLTRVQLAFLKELYREKEYSSFVFIADTSQSIYTHSWLGKGRSFKSVGYNMTGKSQTLNRNYRTTEQISRAAFGLISNTPEIVFDEHFVEPDLIEKQGLIPVYKMLEGEEEQALYIVRQLETRLRGIPLEDIAVIARFNNQLDTLRRTLESHTIPFNPINRYEADFAAKGLKLSTIHSVKGIEFRVVIIIGLDTGVIPHFSYSRKHTRQEEEVVERKLLYVGMTRATEQLYLLSSKRPSPFIASIDPELLIIEPNCRTRRYITLPAERYMFQDRLDTPLEPVERVRQWFLNELTTRYNYPQELLDIDEDTPVITIFIYKYDRKIPYIMVLARSYGSGINDSPEPLEEMLNLQPTGQFGVVTDGNSIRVLNRALEAVDDIPEFDPQTMWTRRSTFLFSDFKRDLHYEITLDESDPAELEALLTETGEFHRFPREELAGIQMGLDEEGDDRFFLPSEWFRGRDFFIVTVEGDAMKEAGLQATDLAIVRRQSSANNKDIVVAQIEEQIMIKRFAPEGKKIRLVDDNDNSTPILLNGGNTGIIGVVVGLLRRKPITQS